MPDWKCTNSFPFDFWFGGDHPCVHIVPLERGQHRQIQWLKEVIYMPWERFANGHDNISFVHEWREHVVFSTPQDKIAWFDPFVEMRPRALR
jgi:hypothetical protein